VANAHLRWARRPVMLSAETSIGSYPVEAGQFYGADRGGERGALLSSARDSRTWGAPRTPASSTAEVPRRCRAIAPSREIGARRRTRRIYVPARIGLAPWSRATGPPCRSSGLYHPLTKYQPRRRTFHSATGPIPPFRLTSSNTDGKRNCSCRMDRVLVEAGYVKRGRTGGVSSRCQAGGAGPGHHPT